MVKWNLSDNYFKSPDVTTRDFTTFFVFVFVFLITTFLLQDIFNEIITDNMCVIRTHTHGQMEPI